MLLDRLWVLLCNCPQYSEEVQVFLQKKNGQFWRSDNMFVCVWERERAWTKQIKYEKNLVENQKNEQPSYDRNSKHACSFNTE